MDKYKFGNWLRKKRVAQRYSLRGLATHADLSHSTLARIEKGLTADPNALNLRWGLIYTLLDLTSSEYEYLNKRIQTWELKEKNASKKSRAW